MSQEKVLIRALKRKWVSTADAFNLGITSFHRRLADIRNNHWVVGDLANGQIYEGTRYLIDGKVYDLTSRPRQIKSRWGVVSIKEWRLVKERLDVADGC